MYVTVDWDQVRPRSALHRRVDNPHVLFPYFG